MGSRPGYRLIKRGIDLVGSLVGLLLLSPVLLLVAAMVRWKLGPPVLFQQERAGLGGKPFKIFKFRSMIEVRDDQGKLLPDADRLPPFGRFLRSTSLDELPQLFNVLLGHMSLVGPRPLYLSYIPRYTPTQHRRLEVKPGITGWAQVNGRNAVDWETRFAHDVYYVDHRSLDLDLRILFLTIKRMIDRKGISAPNQATMPEFMGGGDRHG